VLASVAALSGCAISSDSTPRDVSPEKREELESQAPVGPDVPTSGDDRVFLVGPDDRLRAVLRPANGTVIGQLTSLLEGPNQAERARGLRTVLPADLVLNSVRPGGDVITIDIGPQILELSGADLIRAIGQLVFTASQNQPGVEVVIRVDGIASQWPNGAGVQQSGALTVYDFFGLAETSQPDYPQP